MKMIITTEFTRGIIKNGYKNKKYLSTGHKRDRQNSQTRGCFAKHLYNKIISDYVKCNDDFVINILPAIVRSLVNSELERLSEGAKTTINNVYIAAQK